MSNNNFIATIVEQTGKSGGTELSNDASTIVEKFKSPALRSESKATPGRYSKPGGKVIIPVVGKESYARIGGADKSVIFSKAPKSENISSVVQKYEKGDVNRFPDYVAPKAPRPTKAISGEYSDDSVQEIPVVEVESMGEIEKTDFVDNTFDAPTLYLNDKQLPSANGLVVGDRVLLEVEAEVSNYSLNENSEGMVKQEYTFKLTKGVVKLDS